ncbi:MAG: hypothetical protein HKN82_05325 [Akkermansiaceae bacterium]|nr:hypothetical protein [Akkermansiaceae bacterium]
MSFPRRGILAAMFIAAVCGAMPCYAQTLKIHPMGDSITNGAGGTSGVGGYRGPLYTLLTNAGHAVDYVGTITTNSASLADMDHDGHGGWRIDQVDANVESWFNSIDDPDIILLHIGTNDFGQAFDTPNAINRLDALLTKIAGLRPNAHIIVTNLLERDEPRNTQIQTQFNPYVEGVVNDHIAAGELVSFLDMRALVPLSDMPDNLHPNQTGYDKMAAGWFDAIEAVLDPGDGVPPSITGANAITGGGGVVVNFNKKLDETTAEDAANYALDGGINVLSAELSVNQRFVTLTTDPLTFGTTYTLTVNNVQDQVTPTPNTIAPNSTAQFLAETPRGYLSNVPEGDCYTLVYSLDIPDGPNYFSGEVPYDIDYSDRVGTFDRVAYYLELQEPGGDVQFAWASMDAFTTDLGQIGVPNPASGAVFQQLVNNLNVVSNVAGVAEGTGLQGNIEFWPTNYGAGNAIGIPGASGSTLDFGDTRSTGGNYASMQVHNTSGAQTVIAFNRWAGFSAPADVGIGNNPGTNPDWTFEQNADGFEIKTLQVLVRTAGDVTAPTIASATANFPRTGVTVSFSEPVRPDTLVATNFSFDNGVEVLGVTPGADPGKVYLQTTCHPLGTALTLTVDNVRDTSSNANAIAPGSTIAVTAASLPAEVVANIGAAADGYELVYSLDIPETGDLNAADPYTVDESAAGGAFSRVAYYFALETAGGGVDYVWTAMDAFTSDKGLIGVPLVSTGAVFQQPVTNLDVISNVAGVTNVTGSAGGNLEFWAASYTQANAAAVPGASDSIYDFGDEHTATPGYGSMQVHNGAAGETIFALNHWGIDGSVLDVGIGNRAATHTDWTFAGNAGAYVRRTLHVMVLPTPIPAEITANVTEDTSNYELVYTLDIPSYGNLSSGAGFQDYTVNTSGASSKTFDRVAYYMELQATGDPAPTWVWVSMDAFTDDRGKIGVPNLASGAVWQQLLTDLTVESNSPNVTSGTGLSGNIEFWPTNYQGTNSLPVPGASDAAFDFGDRRDVNGAYGSMQIHNYVAGETLFAINRWGATGNTSVPLCVGIGNNPTPVNNGLDWTFANNAPNVDLLKRLHVMVRSGPSPLGGPQLAGATGSTTLDRLVVTFDREIADSSAVPGNFTLDGGVTVTGATLLEGNTAVALTTSAQAAGQLYTVSVSGVIERNSGGTPIQPGANVQFTAYAPPAILANVPDAGMELIYCLDIPATKPRWNFNPVSYSVDEAQYGEILFDRVGYLMELDGDWVYASFDPHTSQIAQTGVPSLNVTPTAFQQIVTNMNVASNVAGIVTGNGIATGNIEFWGGNYSTGNGIGIPNADGGTFDFGDTMTPGGHGSLQVHNHGASQILFAYNNWGSNSGGASEIGIGTNATGTGHPDWTFNGNAGTYTTRRLYVLARPGGTAGGDAPEILTHPCDRVVAAGSDVTFAVSMLGDGPFTYQWRCNGIPIEGETNSWLTRTSVSAADVAPYDVVVSGPDFASTTSFAADLTLTSGPPSFLVNWRIAHGFHPSDGSTTGEGDFEDKEGDGRSNLLEAAFGTDPNVGDSGSLSVDEGAGTFVPGDPVIHFRWSPFAMTMRYVRLVDHAAAGLVYSPEYLHQGGFIEDPTNPVATRVKIPDGGGGMMDLPVQNIGGFDYEVVEERFMLFDANGRKADSQYGRVRIDAN